MKVHDVCALCAKTCKQPFVPWDDLQSETKFCKEFSSVKIESKLPVETLDSFVKDLEYYGQFGNEWGLLEYLPFLKALREVYIPCTKCSRMIAPDEIYNIENEEPVCQQCFDEENST